jgi:3-dehydroquinate dehydratase-2
VHIAVVNGPNLNLLGVREPGRYGTMSLDAIEASVRARARELGAEISWLQSNHEGELVEAIQALRSRADGALINAAAYTHTSIAIRDAVLAAAVPFVEVHLTNIWGREEERRKSLLADLAVGVVAGFGPQSYLLGLEGIVALLMGKKRAED